MNQDPSALTVEHVQCIQLLLESIEKVQKRGGWSLEEAHDVCRAKIALRPFVDANVQKIQNLQRQQQQQQHQQAKRLPQIKEESVEDTKIKNDIKVEVKRVEVPKDTEQDVENDEVKKPNKIEEILTNEDVINMIKNKKQKSNQTERKIGGRIIPGMDKLSRAVKEKYKKPENTKPQILGLDLPIEPEQTD